MAAISTSTPSFSSPGREDAMCGLSAHMDRALTNLQLDGLKIYETGQKPEQDEWEMDGPNPPMERELGIALGEHNMTALKWWSLEPEMQTPYQRCIFERMSQKHVCELFGSGYFAQRSEVDPPARSITGMRLGPYDRIAHEFHPRKIHGQQYVTPPELCGDLFNANSWRRLHADMKRRDIPAMDFVFMRPEGGWDSVGDSVIKTVSALTYIIGNVIQVLHPEGEFAFYVRVGYNLFPSPFRGDMKDDDFIKQLISRVDRLTRYQLAIQTTLTENKSCTLYLSGSLKPKAQESDA